MPDTLHAYRHVERIYFPIAIGVFALLLATLVILLVRGARRRGAPLGKSNALGFEVGYAALLTGVAVFLLVVTFRAETPLDRTVAHPGLRVTVTAAQWSWRFRYSTGAVVTAVSAWRAPTALVPTGVEVEFSGTSVDVIHGFLLSQLHFQRQFLPGYTTRFDLRFDKAGRYGGQCSVFCGDRHSEMDFEIEAVPAERFARWLRSQPPAGPAIPVASIRTEQVPA